MDGPRKNDLAILIGCFVAIVLAAFLSTGVIYVVATRHMADNLRKAELKVEAVEARRTMRQMERP